MGKKLLKVHKVDFTDDEIKNHQWYTVCTAFNYEQKAADAIMKRAISMDCEDQIVDVIVPIIETEEHSLDKNGNPKKKIKRSKVYGLDGYIYIKMIMNNHTWNVVRQTTGVTGWLNSEGRPLPLTSTEIQKIKEACGLLEVEKKKAQKEFKGSVGQRIRVTNGAASDLEGIISEINTEKSLVKITLDNGFKIEAEFYQVEAI